jgi:hypothetical protein
MPRKCTICTHPERDAIDHALVTGESFRVLSAKYRVSEDALMRHNAAHIPTSLVQAQTAASVAKADNLLGQVQNLQTKVLKILGQAEASGDLRTALQAIREARANVELLARLLGELEEQPSVNLLVSADWLLLRGMILRALDTYPEARLALSAALEKIHDAG